MQNSLYCNPDNMILYTKGGYPAHLPISHHHHMHMHASTMKQHNFTKKYSIIQHKLIANNTGKPKSYSIIICVSAVSIRIMMLQVLLIAIDRDVYVCLLHVDTTYSGYRPSPWGITTTYT